MPYTIWSYGIIFKYTMCIIGLFALMRIVCRSFHCAVVKKQIIASDPHHIASRIHVAVTNNKLLDVVACNTIVSGCNRTILNQNMFAVMQIEAIMTRLDTNMLSVNIFTAVQLMRPVGTVFKSIARRRMFLH